MDNAICHPDDLWTMQYVIRMTYGQCNMSSGWLTILPFVIRMKSLFLPLSHPDDLSIGNISSGWLMTNIPWHPDDIRSFPKSSRWHNFNWILCHPDEAAPDRISSDIRMIFDPLCHPDDLPGVGSWSGWVRANSLCHPDDIHSDF